MFKNFPVNFDIDGSAAKLSGLSYAEIERVALDAVKTAVRKKRKSVTETDFAAAFKSASRRTAAKSAIDGGRRTSPSRVDCRHDQH